MTMSATTVEAQSPPVAAAHGPRGTTFAVHITTNNPDALARLTALLAGSARAIGRDREGGRHATTVVVADHAGVPRGIEVADAG